MNTKLTPATAVALALADFNAAHPNTYYDYTNSLREAERQLNDPVRAAAHEMAVLLTELLPDLTWGTAGRWKGEEGTRRIRTLLAKAGL